MCLNGKSHGGWHFRDKKIASLKRFSLSLSGMRMTYEYEAVANGETTTLARYVYHYGATPERKLEAVTERMTSEVIDKLNELNVGGWDGFVGPHPRNVTDGEMFNFCAETDEEKSIRASGSENFPPHYRELKDWLGELLPW